MKQRRMVLAAGLLAMSLQAMGQGLFNPDRQTLFGGYDCGQWVTAGSGSVAAKAWLTGYLSGVNAALGAPGSGPLNKLNSADQFFVWMDNYCRANPLKTVVSGANQLFRELQGAK